MSLTSSLKDPASPVSRFLTDRLPGTAHVISSIRGQLPPPEMTVRPQGGQRYDYRSLGRAIDRRLRVAFGSPLDAALAAGVAFAEGEAAAQSGQAVGRAVHRAGRELLAELKSQPPVLAGRPPGEEQRLARLCFVASHFEEIYRAGLHSASPLLQLATGEGLEALLAGVPAYVPADLARQVELAAAHDALGWVTDLPAGQRVCAPTFSGSTDVGGADADFIAAGRLIDCKATVRPEKIGVAEIHQLAGYLLLDYDDRYGVDHVSLYLSRQGRLVSWGSQEFLDLLGSRSSLQQLRTACRQALTPTLAPPPSALPRQAGGVQGTLFNPGR
ncbi:MULTISPECIES: hypothetical protein [Streptomyces]|uniref:hypothetical protein n=1 Tax=Streptomyces sp. NPDC005386 TaxID=3154562 RepID=UPI0033B31937